MKKILLTYLLFVCVSEVTSQEIRELGSLSMRRPGFTAIFEHDDATDATEQFSIIISCFNPIPGTRDDVNFIRYVI